MFRNVKNYYPTKHGDTTIGFNKFKGFGAPTPVVPVVPSTTPPSDFFSLVKSSEGRDTSIKTDDSSINKLIDSLNFIKTTIEIPKYKGENHATLKVGENADGTAIFKKGAWIGPGTNIDKRIGKTKPITRIDAAANRHDLAYSLHTGDESIREADVDFLNAVNSSNDYPINKLQGNLIAAKVGLENIGVMKRDHYAGDGKIGLSKNQITSYEAELESMKQAGYGSKNKRSGWNDEDVAEYKRVLRPKPGSRLIESVMKKKKKKKNKIPKKYRQRIEQELDIKDKFNDDALPQNVLDALGLM